MMDLTKDFYYSYSYHVMSSLQKNVCNNETGQNHHETMFVWNEYLTRDMKRSINSNLWTVALVYGFFKQVIDINSSWRVLSVSRCRHSGKT